MAFLNKKHTAQLLEIVKGVTIHDNRSFSVGEKKITVYNQTPFTSFSQPLAVFGNNTRDEQRGDESNLIAKLSSTLYEYFYCGLKGEEIRSIPVKSERDAFVDKLSENNHSTITHSLFWQVYSVDANGNAFAQKNGRQRYMLPGSYQLANPVEQQVQVNSYVHFVREKEQIGLQPVFYYVNSDAYFEPGSRIMRVYWNITPEGAPVLVKEISTVLNEYKIPFSFKCLNHPDLYKRNDSAVLYFDKQYMDIILILLKGILSVVKPYLNKEIPWFTEPLYTGVSLAEDPMNGDSFGMSRTKAIAEALVDLHRSTIDTNQKKVDFLCDYLAQKGIHKEKIFLNCHTSNLNDFSRYKGV